MMRLRESFGSRLLAIALLVVVSAPITQTHHSHGRFAGGASHTVPVLGTAPADPSESSQDESHCVTCDLLASGLTSAIPPITAIVALIQPPTGVPRSDRHVILPQRRIAKHDARAPPVS